MTRKLYYEDPYMTEFTAQVLEVREEKGKFLVRLDATAFYPEGGGQPYDTGMLSGEKVLEVHERDGEIWHTLSAPLKEGRSADGSINWPRRFDLMQQHSGEHILSGILHEMTGCDNVGFHLSTDNIYVDFDKPIEWETLLSAESRANRYIWENHPVEISFPSPEELKSLSYRSKKALSGEVRIVAFPGADVCACCGTHVAFSGEIGQIRVLTVQNWKGGVRVEMACGSRALSVSRSWMNQTLSIARALSVKPENAFAAVQKLSEELAAVKTTPAELPHKLEQVVTELKDSAREIAMLNGRLAEGQLEQMRKDARRVNGVAVFNIAIPGTPVERIRMMGDKLKDMFPCSCALFCGGSKEKPMFVCVAGPDAVKKGVHAGKIIKEVCAVTGGKGGGRPDTAQGGVGDPFKVDEAMAILDDLIASQAKED